MALWAHVHGKDGHSEQLRMPARFMARTPIRSRFGCVRKSLPMTA